MFRKLFLFFLLLFLFFSFSFSKEKIWEFNNPDNYQFNEMDIDVWGGQAKTQMYFREGDGISDNGTDSWKSVFADFNNDGKLDVYLSDWGQNKLWLQKGIGEYEEKNIPGDKMQTQAVAVADFNNDGNIDIYVANLDGQNKIWLNDGKANFKLFEIDGDEGSSYGVYVDDFNNDNLVDIYVRNREGDKVWISGFKEYKDYVPLISNVNPLFFEKSVVYFGTDEWYGNISFQISLDGGLIWYFWNRDSGNWEETEKNDGRESSNINDINNNITSLMNNGGGWFKWRAYFKNNFNENGEINPSSYSMLGDLKIIYDEEVYAPEFIEGDDYYKINEGFLEVGQFKAIDKNIKDEVRYYLMGIDSKFFSINPESGEVSLINPLDYEDPLDANSDNIYEFSVVAFDNSRERMESIKRVKVEIVNLDFNISSFNGKEEVYLEGGEGVKDIIQIEVQNPEKAEIVFKLEESFDYDKFKIDPESGQLSFKIKTRFDDPRDENGDNIYEVVVIAEDKKDPENNDKQKYFISILDIEAPENLAPKINMEIGKVFNLDLRDFYIMRVDGEDEDSDYVEFEISGGEDADKFEIAEYSGDLFFKEKPYFLNPGDKNKDNVYEVIIKVSDNGEPVLSDEKTFYLQMLSDLTVKLINFEEEKNKKVCKDKKADNFKLLGIHEQEVCIYDLGNKDVLRQIESEPNCPSDKILTQNMIIGDRDGQYSGWEKKIVKEVKILQEHLNRLGNFGLEENGKFDLETEKAVMNIQERIGQDVTGYVDRDFRRRINSSCLVGLVVGNEIINENTFERDKRIDYLEAFGTIQKAKVILQDIINSVR